MCVFATQADILPMYNVASYVNAYKVYPWLAPLWSGERKLGYGTALRMKLSLFTLLSTFSR
jgi:hypothetical protein